MTNAGVNTVQRARDAFLYVRQPIDDLKEHTVQTTATIHEIAAAAHFRGCEIERRIERRDRCDRVCRLRLAPDSAVRPG
jgi:hypothetical protein